jgi:hypothetical protein
MSIRKHAFIGTLLVIAGIAEDADAGTRWRGRCHSQNTGTDLGFVYASTQAGLTAECAKIATSPIVSNYTQIDCELGRDYGCRGESQATIATCVDVPPSPPDNKPKLPSTIRWSSEMKIIDPFDEKTACVTPEQGATPSKSYCWMSTQYGDPGGLPCSAVAGRSDACAVQWAFFLRWEEEQVGEGRRKYCVTFFNQSGGETRYLWLHLE